ncbi:MAG: hypothetical protein F4Y29_04090 [Chloroflexi bacterium]|nr:hypothetical protein [Chloroflexota bacterium]
MDTTDPIAAALAQARPELVNGGRTANALAREARRALERWGHGEHELVLERVSAFGDPLRLRCLFWCESCHVPQQVILPGP